MSKRHETGHHGGRPPAPDRLPLPVVDNHTHLDISRDGGPLPDLTATIAEASAVGVDRMVQIGCDLDGARFTERVIDEHPQLLGGVALHPNEAPALAERGETDAARAEIERIAQHPRVRVVGETGLDYFRTGPEGVAAQQDSFRWHIDLAKRLGKALQIHDRDSHDDVLRILAEEGAPEHTVLHCFSGDIEMARECVRRGYLLSFAGTVTFKNARELRNALSVVPLDQLLVETDAPYLTPSPHRGATNAPYLVPLTVRAMAAVLNTDVPTLCENLSATSERVYGPWA
ncbi:TatD DNase family protein [Barrientosiimonas humi]|uniref:TatD DNase family protein n=1 Tax=Barrientosiimonas humi TaxID=999931 RepID=A0A542XEN8_9MICO|nr:TatD family hydrolase [Barrientosiimonas humi]TQL34287.1 TatD DNase family protein [Barrientosiimonas humi]CAG7574278.1 putative metal-dependent hydrolase TatD [Barrientosiimonas humi]